MVVEIAGLRESRFGGHSNLHTCLLHMLLFAVVCLFFLLSGMHTEDPTLCGLGKLLGLSLLGFMGTERWVPMTFVLAGWG